MNSARTFNSNNRPPRSFSSDRPRSTFGKKSHSSSRPRTSRAPQQGDTKSFAKKPEVKIPPPGDNIRIVPLGGVEEVGRNMTMIEYKNDIIVIDAGLQFKEEGTPGIDYILPNTKYLQDRKDKIRGVFITHGHLDHIGGIPYLMPLIGNPPMYSRQFGALMIQRRQEEFAHLPPLNMHVLQDKEQVRISDTMTIETFPISHTIPDSMGLIIKTPIGEIVFIEDVRVDNVNGVPTQEEVDQYERFKDRNVLLLTMDSTSIEKHGFSLSESTVIKNIEKIMKASTGRMIIGTFASQVERIISIIQIAGKYNKKIVIEGRSMKTNIEIIKQLNLLDVKNIIPLEQIEQYPPDRIVMLVTGAQGEEFAALMRIANKSHKYVRLRPNDTIILSSSIIPTNYNSVVKLKDNLYRSGNRDELKWIHERINYKFFMPVHGNHFMLRQHAELAHSLGVPKENVVVPDNGSIIEITPDGQKINVLKEKAPDSLILVDGFSVGDMQEVVLRDRQMLAQDGMFVIIASINTSTGKLKKSPDIISRGFVYLRESQDLLQQTRYIIKKTIEDSVAGMHPINFDYVKQVVTDNVSKYLFQQTAKRPIVIPVLLGV
jgi:ribonuclease J